MQTKTNKGLEVREGRTYLKAPHLDGEINFVYPAKGSGNYIDVAEELKKDNLSQPTMSQNASLIYSAWQNPKEKYSKEVINTLGEFGLWCFNGILCAKEGAYIKDNPEIKNGRVSMNEKDLLSKLESSESSVRFVPYGYKVGKQSAKELAKNKFVQALAGEEGADKLAETSSNYQFEPHLFSLENPDKELIRVASLGGGRGRIDGGLLVLGLGSDVSWGGHVFGVSEAS
ncbi:MAG: hypothetical protein AABX83_02820 [Nanoarchaeota archaeon]